MQIHPDLTLVAVAVIKIAAANDPTPESYGNRDSLVLHQLNIRKRLAGRQAVPRD